MSLTNRQLEIFRLKKSGMSNKEIADKLDVSESYISQTLGKISQKITTIEDSLHVLRELGEISEFAPVLTEKGRIKPRVPDWMSPIKPRVQIQKIYYDDLIKWYIDFPGFRRITTEHEHIKIDKAYDIVAKSWVIK